MSNNLLLGKAIHLALDAHGQQLDKAGMLYILHPLHVMDQVQGIDAKIVAVLHDVVEDCNFEVRHETSSLFDVSANTHWQFPKHIIKAIDAITKRKLEKNVAYWQRVKDSPLALRVKLADIAHNSSEERLAALPMEEQEYLRSKYAKARIFLT